MTAGHSWGTHSKRLGEGGRREWSWRCSCGAYSERYRTKHAAERGADAHVTSIVYLEGLSRGRR